jgi:hypothetical protein
MPRASSPGCLTRLGLGQPGRLLMENTCPEGQIDGREEAAEDGAMSEVTSETPRRSGRVFHRIRIKAEGRTHDRKKFKETCETVVVNVHGGLLLLKHEVNNGEMLVLTNPLTQEEQECRVVYLGEPVDKGQRVGVEFLTPAPRFWGVEFTAEPSSSNIN